MNRADAVDLVRTTIDAHYGVTRLRFTTRGSFAGTTTRLEVTTLAGPGKRNRGTQEQRLVATDSLRENGPWFQAILALDPDIILATGCAETTGFDVDAGGNLSSRHGTRRSYEDAERRWRRDQEKLAAQQPEPTPRRELLVDLDSVMFDYSTAFTTTRR